MNKLIRLLSASLLFTLFITSCGPDDPPATPQPGNGKLRIQLQATSGSSPLILGNKYSTSDGQEFTADVLKFYLSDLKLIKEDGSTLDVKDLVLVDFAKDIQQPYDKNSIGTEFTFEVPAQKYIGFKTGIGVPKRMNVVSADYPNEHPLSGYRGTDWAWAGFRFIMFQGKAYNASGEPKGFSYHIVTDTFYQSVNFNKKILINKDATQDIVIQLDINKLFRPSDNTQRIDPVSENITHSEGTEAQIQLAWRVNRNFAKALSL